MSEKPENVSLGVILAGGDKALAPLPENRWRSTLSTVFVRKWRA